MLQSIRHESNLAQQHTYIQATASRNAITFDAACDDQIVCDDVLRADLLLNSSSRPCRALAAMIKCTVEGLVSTTAKKAHPPTTTCLVEDCEKPRSRGMCRRHFVELTSGKVASFPLRENWGTATYNAESGIVLSNSVPVERRMAGPFKPKTVA